MTIDEYKVQLGTDSLQSIYFTILQNQEWHCRKCAQQEIGSEQLAGGGGVQGLQRGTKSRPGVVIESKKQHCSSCNKKTNWDRWTGEFKESNSAYGISKKLQKKILDHYKYEDSIEQRRRTVHELIIDHRFPMQRWGGIENPNKSEMNEEQIQRKFQLLKKDSSGNHNLLKSRACERCITSGKRGYPMGVKFFYQGTEDWPEGCPNSGIDAEIGCIGCGWYDFDTWRNGLNQKINKL
ncbi:hypothetical protein [Dehalobacter sp.]|uniref:hypothetical protein n=1 Tax=Dehalobacter sp. TaxID=1962289 RepID=UPI00258E3600|nr:hypothetical protein [Dehalobacter sp.]MCG1024511.1 hypothetical protein [Dehalobacter sp.]